MKTKSFLFALILTLVAGVVACSKDEPTKQERTPPTTSQDNLESALLDLELSEETEEKENFRSLNYILSKKAYPI